MKKIFLALAAFCLLLSGCGAKTPAPQTGAYFLEGADVNSTQSMAPFLTLDSEKQSFIFFYDTLAAGSYTVKDDVLTATVQGGQSYRFKIRDEKTLALQLDGGEEAVFRFVTPEEAGS